MKVRLLLVAFLISFILSAQRSFRVVGYYTGTDSLIQHYPVSELTHVIFSFLKLQNDTFEFYDERQQKIAAGLVDLKRRYPSLKIMVSIGGWGGCATCSELFSDSLHRAHFASTAVDLLRANHLDGLDLDWEYPAIEGYPGHRYDPADRDHFTALVKAIRAEMKDSFELSFAAGGFIDYLENSIDWNAVMPEVDFVNLMTYDLVGGYSTVTGHHTPLRSSTIDMQSMTRCVNWLLDHGVPSRKLVPGAAFYARVWENVPDTNHGLFQSGKFRQGVAFKNFDTYFADSLDFRQYEDRRAKAPYRYSARQHLFATYDDRRSVRAKAKYVKKHSLGGLMFWELSLDAERNGLLDEIHRQLRNR